MFLDFHAHLHASTDPDSYMSGLVAIDSLAVACSVDIPSYLQTLALSERCARIIPTFGVHPSKAELYESCLDSLSVCAGSSDLIGEIGLDQRWWRAVPASAQERVFAWFLDYCAAHDKYCVIHTKGAERRVLEMLRHHRVEKAIIHWYHGPLGIFKKFLDLGCYQTFGCELRYSWAVRRQLSLTPAELILSETDNPDAEPWLGGRTNGPELIARVVGDIARVRHLRPELAALLTAGNALRILRHRPASRGPAADSVIPGNR